MQEQDEVILIKNWSGDLKYIIIGILENLNTTKCYFSPHTNKELTVILNLVAVEHLNKGNETTEI